MEEGKCASKILTGKPIGKRPLGRPRRRWEDNIRMDLKTVGINKRNWVDSAQVRDYWRALLKTKNLRVRIIQGGSYLVSLLEVWALKKF